MTIARWSSPFREKVLHAYDTHSDQFCNANVRVFGPEWWRKTRQDSGDYPVKRCPVCAKRVREAYAGKGPKVATCAEP